MVYPTYTINPQHKPRYRLSLWQNVAIPFQENVEEAAPDVVNSVVTAGVGEGMGDVEVTGDVVEGRDTGVEDDSELEGVEDFIADEVPVEELELTATSTQ